MLWFWGLCGAFIFGTTRLIAYWYDNTHTIKQREQSLVKYAVVLITGAISAQIFSDNFQRWASKFIELTPISSAFLVGLLCNLFWPFVISLTQIRFERQIKKESED